MSRAQPSPLQYMLLAHLIRERNGVQLAEVFARHHRRELSIGTLYTTLRRMAEDGWITMRADPVGDGRARLYQISGEGRLALSAMTASHARTLAAMRGA